jgi:hypothetical protein
MRARQIALHEQDRVALLDVVQGAPAARHSRDLGDAGDRRCEIGPQRRVNVRAPESAARRAAR